jgi:tRNA U34 2-thiouridine synthase MnmA/TrmU
MAAMATADALVIVALSGGVDSAPALLLKQRGFRVRLF